MSDLWSAIITTVGALAGSFGGFTLAARSQRKQAEREDARAVREADRARSVKLEDERHEFQLTTLLALQELTRRKARSTILLIEEDRTSIKTTGGYRQLSPEDPDDFAKAVEFAHNIARVTNSDLRSQLESFQRLCGEYTLPPPNWSVLEKEAALTIQERRAVALINLADDTASLLGTHLRKEIDRHDSSASSDGRRQDG